MTYLLNAAEMIVSLPLFTNNKNIQNDPKLAIVYELINATTGTAYSGLITSTSFNDTMNLITIQTSDDSLPRLN